MRIAVVDDLLADQQEHLLTTGEAAQLLGSTRQHVVDLCKRGDLPFLTVGTHRRVRRADIEQARSRTQALTRDQRRSLWLGHAIAGKLVADPESVLTLARDNLERLRSQHTRGQASRWLGEWDRLLDGPVERILETLTSATPRARELRQNSPFAGVLTEQERAQVLQAWHTHSGSKRQG